MAVPCVGRCTIAGEHLSTCLGIRVARAGAAPCEGCLPQPAERGLLCFSCSSKVNEMWAVLFDVVAHMRSVERGPADDTPVRSAPGSRVIIPPSWQAADETWEALHVLMVAAANEQRIEVPRWVGQTTWRGFGSTDTVDDVMVNVWVATFWLLQRADLLHEEANVARRLLQLVRKVQRALDQFPLRERAHLVEHIWCRKCQTRSLQWEPPLAYRDLIVVRCISPGCGETFDPALVEVDIRQLREQLEQHLQVVT